jgi:hypothetical protein
MDSLLSVLTGGVVVALVASIQTRTWQLRDYPERLSVEEEGSRSI